jgi:hypothetical protein
MLVVSEKGLCVYESSATTRGSVADVRGGFDLFVVELVVLIAIEAELEEFATRRTIGTHGLVALSNEGACARSAGRAGFAGRTGFALRAGSASGPLRTGFAFFTGLALSTGFTRGALIPFAVTTQERGCCDEREKANISN